MTVDPDSYLGREVAGYQVEEVIGRGGMGVVYRAEHLRLGRKVALKVVAPQIAREPKFRERFLRESRTAGSLDHPNVVPIYDAGEADGVLYIAMRFVDGVDLATLISRDGRLEAARTARIVAQVASALDAAHEAGLVHRDVKPSNVLLPARGAGRGEHAYLGDFGLTKRVLSESGVTGSSAFLGTIAYVAPEQIEGRPVDAKADQYSLACLVYECLTGHRPFERETDVATLYAHLRDPFPSVGDAVEPDIRSALDGALARAAAKKPADRFDSCGDLAEDLVRITGAPTGTGSQPVAVRRARSAAQSRRRLAVGFGSAALVAALAIGGYLLWQSNQSAAPIITGHGVAIIDTTTDQASLGAELANEPTAIAADPTAAWVTHSSAGRVSRVDAVTRVITSVAVGAGPRAVVAGAAEGLVWVANTTAETLSEIDAENPSRAPITMALLFRPGALALGDAFLWVIDKQADSVTQIDAERLRLENDPVSVGAEPVAIAAGGGVVWVANSLDQSLSRLTVALTTADAPIALGFTPGALALDAETDAVWIVDAAGDAVVRFDTRSRDQVVRVSVGSRPTAIAIGGGAVWVANYGDGTVSRIDPATNEVVATITIGGTPVGVAVSGETVWVAVAER